MTPGSTSLSSIVQCPTPGHWPMKSWRRVWRRWLGCRCPRSRSSIFAGRLNTQRAEAYNETWVEGLPPSEGPHFGSAFPGDPAETLVHSFLPERILRRSRAAVVAMLGGFAFDVWTCNRNPRQMIFWRLAREEGSDYSPWLTAAGGVLADPIGP
jgi:hypothetical protein